MTADAKSGGGGARKRGARAARATATVKTRKEQFIEAATRAMELHGYHAMSMETLAAEAGVSVGLVYYYFKNKDEVLLAVILDILENYRRQLPAAMSATNDPVEKLAAGFLSYLRVIDTHRHAAVLAYRESKTLSKRGRIRIKNLEIETTQLMVDPIEAGVASGVLATEHPGLVGYDLVLMAHMWALKYWYFQPAMTVEVYGARQLALVLNSIVRPEYRRKYRKFIDVAAT